jgi:hypothetical protein
MKTKKTCDISMVLQLSGMLLLMKSYILLGYFQYFLHYRKKIQVYVRFRQCLINYELFLVHFLVFVVILCFVLYCVLLSHLKKLINSSIYLFVICSVDSSDIFQHIR